MKPRILITEDDDVQREVIVDILRLADYDVAGAASAPEAVAALENEPYDLLVTDMRMPGMDGLELLRKAKRLRPEMEAVVMTAYATVETAVTAMKEGAADYLAKPFDKEELLIVVGRVLEHGTLLRQNRQLRELVSTAVALGNIVGESPVMQRVFEVTRRAIPVDSTVLIQGESGTGKELVARHIHFEGPRRRKPFIVVNCAAIPDNLVESELFGHEKGAFTGAEAAREGKFEIADGGTLFLDEIGDMELGSQAKLLRVLQDGVVERVGSSRPKTVNVRVIVATNRDLRARVRNGQFREDLYFRLDVLPINLPPLRERIEDLPLLISHFRRKLADKLGRPVPALGPDALDAMRRYRWPGNVRELENTLEQLFILSDGDILGVRDLPEKLRDIEPTAGPFRLPAGGLVLEELEEDLIRQALDRSGGRIKEAAELLGLTYKTLQYRLKKHDIDRRESEPENKPEA
ncbi:MAG TPA: sigma-54 dependent transcriptional regulator [Candidatus Hydrogenedentes bacterium]|nr:sigma-54 dependent transcriptional regulator [Candidatus Hydrogenedentota bacterium]HPG65995.1 sigma-54 dependent transcriptional regulator [Candidatus Hydrogenedentota bacterium]